MYSLPTVDPEFKALIPPLTNEEYNQLEQNIITAGQCYEAILVWDGMIVDGFNRFCICATHGIGFNLKEVHFPTREEAKLWIIENQLGRRNLTDAARIELALCKENMLREKARENQARAGGYNCRPLSPKSSNPESMDTEEAIAKSAEVGKGTLQRYKQLKKRATPELLARVHSGEIKIGTAYKMLGRDIFRELLFADRDFALVKDVLQFDSPYKQPMLEQLAILRKKMLKAQEYLKEVYSC
jgi:hypothetical protein